MRVGLLALLIVCGCDSTPEAAGNAAEGSWRVTTIDGDPVGGAVFEVRVRGGRVIGGKDGCGAWIFDYSRPPAPDGTRMVLSELTPCSAMPQRSAYWRAVGNGNVRPRLAGEGHLRLAAGGSELLARPLPARP
jgi:hypothetical protein